MRSAPSRTSRTPSSRMPVPASRITTSQPGGRSSMHDVFPPYRSVSWPGEAIDPRLPQIFPFTGDPLRWAT